MATNYAYATYTEVIDLQTVADTQTIIGIHTPVGASPYQRLKGFFNQFRKYKYNGIKSLIMVPSAQLPVDPLGLTGVVGTTDLMDPRDVLNPILFHGCHGEHLDEILDEIYNQGNYVGAGNNNFNSNGGNVSPSADEFRIEQTGEIYNYYSKLTDSSWRKFGIQSGVKLSGLRPLVHQVVQNMPTLPAMMVDGVSGDNVYRNTGVFQSVSSNTALNPIGNAPDSSPFNDSMVPMGQGQVVNVDSIVGDIASTTPEFVYKQQFTNKMTGLGWLPTAIMPNVNTTGTRPVILPKCFMGILVLPPAYNVEQYFRMVITHSFSFKDFTSSLGLMDLDNPVGTTDLNIPYANWIDYGGDSKIKQGTTLDMLGGDSTVVSDGVM